MLSLLKPCPRQREVFAEVMNDSVASVLKGVNATILAYGQV